MESWIEQFRSALEVLTASVLGAQRGHRGDQVPPQEPQRVGQTQIRRL